MGKPEELLKEFLIAQNKLANDLLIKYYGDESFQTADKTAGQQRTATEDDIRRVEDQFLKRLQDHLIFEQKGEYVLVKPKAYLGAGIFNEVSAIVRDRLGGEYVSAGKNSHFKVRKRMK